MDDTVFMRQALQLAQMDPSEVPVGAVVVKDNRVIAVAHNEQFASQNALAHAEMLALQRAQEALGTSRLQDCTLYVTLEPCPMCAGGIILTGIKRCVFAAFDTQYGCCGSVYALPMDPVFHHSVLCEGGLLAEESRALLNAFFQRQRHEAGKHAKRQGEV